MLARLLPIAVLLALALPSAAAADPLELNLDYKAGAVPDLKCKGLKANGNGAVSGNVFPAGAAWHDDECLDILTRVGTFGITGTGSATATNGDGLRFTYRATSPLPDLSLSLRPTGTFTVTGGTGALAGATGGGTLTATVALLTQRVTGRVAGTLELP
jgi:hypothetical protein